jgi:hypothetical protein
LRNFEVLKVTLEKHEFFLSGMEAVEEQGVGVLPDLGVKV